MDENNVKVFQFSYVSPVCLLRALFRNCWMIVATALVFAMTTTFVLNWFHVPQYQATMTYSVNSRTTGAVSSGNLGGLLCHLGCIHHRLRNVSVYLDADRGLVFICHELVQRFSRIAYQPVR